jgi:hypothetical protein
MSLINDALKQAKQSRPPNPPPDPPPLSPVESASHRGMGWLVPVVIILLLVTAGIFIGLSMSKPVPLIASAPTVAATQPVPPALPSPQPVAVATNPASAESNMVAVTASPPEPKLQGVLFDATRPCAIVSGDTVFVGDHVDGFRVAAISRDSVTLQGETETKVLSLSRR